MQIETTKAVHHGRNVKRIREIMGIKQDALAMDLGISQQAISALEQREALDREILEKIAKALKVSPEAIERFNEESVITNISCDFHDFHDHASVFQFNPLEKIIELYERMLKDKNEMIEKLEKIIAERK